MAATLTAWAPDRSEVIWINFNPSSGHEIPDWHPMLVSSTKTFNRHTGIVIGFPLTHSTFHADNPFAIPIITGPDQEKAYLLAFQPKSFDWQKRGAKPHPLGIGHERVLTSALKILGTICGNHP
jgi:mRNA interferase MazF